MFRFFSLVGILFSLTYASFAQSGWEHIKQDDNIAAKKAFLEVLEKDSTDRSALEGMIYLCDVEDDNLGYDKYANSLLVNHYNDYLFQIFESSSDWEGQDILDNPAIDKRFKIRYELGKAIELKEERKFAEAKKIMQSEVNNFQWSYLGPFKNINGYGHIKNFEVEADAFDTAKVYVNKDKYQLKWLTPKYIYPIKTLDFDDVLMEDRHGSTFYANTFFEVEEEKEVFFSISRYYPIKIWLDDALIFESKEFINYNWEYEKVKLNLPKGNHRLMVKYSESDYFTGINNTYNNSIHEYGYSDYRNYDSKRGEGYISPYNSNELVIRITDEKGETIAMNSTIDKQSYDKTDYETTIIADECVKHYAEQLKADTTNWFNYYMLSNSYFNSGRTNEIEEYFADIVEENDVTFFKFIMFQLYNINGKKEKGFLVLNGIDHDKTPVFSVLKKELKELDMVNQAEEYEAALKRLLEISPSNRYAINKLLRFYDKHGRVQDRVAYAKEVIAAYPSYEYWLEDYTKEDFKPNDYDIGKEQPKDPKKAIQEAKKGIQKKFLSYQYEKLIKYYKSKEKETKVLELYDEYLSVNDYSRSKRRAKAKYLFNLERYDEALVELKTLLEIDPYDEDTYELIGDIYNDQDKDSLALLYYQTAKEFPSGWNSDLDKKIDQLAGQQELKKKFKTFAFDDWMQDRSWMRKYYQEESVIIGYSTDMYLAENGSVTRYCKMLIQILTEAGANSWTEYNFNRIGSIQYIKVVKPNGAELFPDLNGSFVVFKNLQPGDMIMFETEDSYTPNSELGSYLHNFQDMIFHAPVNFAKMEIIIPEEQNLQYILHKLDDSVVTEVKDGEKHYTWEYQNLEKHIQEEAIVDVYDTYTHIQFNTLPDWGGVVEWYEAKTYRKLEPNYELQRIMDTLITEGMSDQEKVVAIYNFITKEITYSATRLLQNGYIPKNTELTCSGKIGDCKDVATLMISMLRSQGIDAYYVLVKTNSMFHQKTLPSTYFDHVIAGVVLDGEMQYYDLTTDFYPYYVTNENDMSAWALVIKEGETQIRQLPNDYLNRQKNLVKHVITANVNLDKSVEMNIDSEFHGMRGGRIREIYFNKPREDMENEMLTLLGKGVFNNVLLEEYDFKNPKEITTPFQANYSMKAQKHVDNVLDIYFLTVPYMTGIETHQAILTEKRYNTLNLYEVTKIEPTLQEVYINFPKGMKLYKLPQDIKESSVWGDYEVKFERTAKGIKVTKFQKFNVAEVPVEKYQEFKAFYLTLLEHDKTKIVFVTK